MCKTSFTYEKIELNPLYYDRPITECFLNAPSDVELSKKKYHRSISLIGIIHSTLLSRFTHIKARGNYDSLLIIN